MRHSFSIAFTATFVFYLAGINGHPAQTLYQQSPLQQTAVMGADPTQNQQCPKLKVLKFQGNSPLDQVTNWSVVKVASLSPTAVQGVQSPELQSAFCKAFSGLADCVGISYSTSMNGDPTAYVAQTFAYNGKSQDLAQSQRVFKLMDQTQQIWSISDPNNKAAQTVTTAMNEASNTQSGEMLFGAIAENPQGLWKMLGDCEATMAWVVASSEALKADPTYLDTYKMEIENTLEQIKSSLMSTMSGVTPNTKNSPVSTGGATSGGQLPIVAVFSPPSSSMVSGVSPSPPEPSLMPWQHQLNSKTNDNTNNNNNLQQVTPSNSALAYATIGSPSAAPSAASPSAVLFSAPSSTTPSFVIQSP